MTHLHNVRPQSILKWGFSNSFNPQKTPFLYTAETSRFYGSKRGRKKGTGKGSYADQKRFKEACVALLDYLHSTRGIDYAVAGHLSENSPHFVGNLLKKMGSKADSVQSIVRFLRYHPINEFEPFFESSGLKPEEYGPLVSQGLTFLSDDILLLENYKVLCNYGVERNKIGKIYKEAGEVFGYGYGVLTSKLRAYEELGFEQAFIGKMVACSPCLLTGDVNIDFVTVMQKLMKWGIEFSWVEEQLAGKSVSNWRQMVALINLLMKTGYSEEQLGMLIRQHPGLLFESSAEMTLLLVGFLIKLGSPMHHISSIFLQFPQMQVGKFVSNLKHCFSFLNEIEMEMHEIGKIFQVHPTLLGSCTLKKTKSLLTLLNVGKTQICKIIQDNPEEMKKWVMGLKVVPLPREDKRSENLKKEFLINIGFEEKTKELEGALKAINGERAELQERFDCFMKAGIHRKDVCKMICRVPQILNMEKDVIKAKIDFLLNDLGYPITYLVSFPSYLRYTIPRVKLRLTMYNWLKDQGQVGPIQTLSTCIACSDAMFVERYVNRHDRGVEVWENLKKSTSSE